MKKMIMNTVLSTTLLLSACSLGTSTQEQLSDSLTKLYEEEQGYREAQEKMGELEKKEQITFNSTMELTQEQKDEVTLKVKELKDSLSERLSLLNQEVESIHNAQASLISLDELIEDTKEEKIKTSLNNLSNALENRYAAHQVVSDEYRKITVLQEDLYNMLADEKTEQNELEEQVQRVNEQNEIVQSAIDAFNEATKNVNKTKAIVYDNLTE